MGRNKEYELAIKIAGEIEKSFYDSTKLTKKELRDIANQAARTAAAAESLNGISAKHAASIREHFAKELKNSEPIFSGLETAAKASFAGITKAAIASSTTVTAGFAASIHYGSEFESAFAGVKKTVNASNAELAQMRSDLRGMAKDDIPLTAAELSNIAESAGQLGIRNENITGFTKTMANMDVATDLGSDTAASEFAKFANITKMSQDKFSNLGSSVVALGNNMATTESDTVSMAMRIAAAGKQVKLSEADIMAYSAALSSVGIEAEAGGSAFSKFIVNLQMAAETGKNLDDYAGVAGMTGKEFKKAFQEDATVAINAFLSGLNDTKRNGKSAIAVLSEMGLTEVRLRDTMLRAGNASSIFTDALAISNKAWEENTALTNEAEQRYRTFESQCQMTKNKIADIGISIYDDLRPGLTEGIALVNEFISGMEGKEDALGNNIKKATKAMPTMVRNVKEAGESIREFSEPFLKTGSFLVDNPGIITGTIASIGTALATYKIATGIMSITSALGALNPVGMAILGLGGVAGVITGISTSVKKAAAEAKKANLNAHFGNIALSLEDLQAAASNVVRNQELDKMRESIAAMGEAEGIADDIQAATEELNRMNWKVSVGMELTETEQEAYREEVENYISSTQTYLTERQYAVNLAVGVLTDDDLEGTNIVTKINQFYQGKMEELKGLGTQLNVAITDAFNDGLLDIDEITEITKLQSQMAEIQNSLTGAEYDANIELLHTKYSVGDLNAESFRNLQAELQEQTAAASADYEKSFVLSVSNADVMRQEGDIGQAEYDSMVAEFRKNYLENVGDLQAKAADFQAQAISEQYGDEIGSIDINEKIRNVLQDRLAYVANSGNAVLGFDERLLYEDLDFGMDEATQAALAELWEDLSPQLEQMNRIADEYRAAGEAVPASLEEGINDTAAIGALVGDRNALYLMMGEEARNSEEYTAMVASLLDQGTYIPEQIAVGIRSNKQVVIDALNEIMTVGIDVSGVSPDASKGKTVTAVGHADGGIFDRPHLAWIAEAGYSEATIPIDGSQNAIDLWLKTGELLGMDGLTGGESPVSEDMEEAATSGAGNIELHIDNSRVITINGNASKEDIEEALENDADEFDRMMQEWMARNRRLKFV